MQAILSKGFAQSVDEEELENEENSCCLSLSEVGKVVSRSCYHLFESLFCFLTECLLRKIGGRIHGVLSHERTIHLANFQNEQRLHSPLKFNPMKFSSISELRER